MSDAPTIEEIQKQSEAKEIFTKVAEEFGGKVTEWERSSNCIGLWDYADMQLLDANIRVGTSGGGVISIDRKSHDLNGRVIDNEDSARSTLVAAILNNHSILSHPKTYDDVLQVVSYEDIYGDILDVMIKGRIRAVKNELLELEWKAEKGVVFVKDENKLYVRMVHCDSDINKITGCKWWRENYGASGVFVEDFTKSPKHLAEMMNSARQELSSSNAKPLTKEWFDSRFDKDTPDVLRNTSEVVCATYNICGLSDPMYIANILAFELGFGDGSGKFATEPPEITEDALLKAAKRLCSAYATASGNEAPENMLKLISQSMDLSWQPGDDGDDTETHRMH